MTVSSLNQPHRDVCNLQVQLASTLEQIDRALDRGDRRAFTVWCKKWRSLSGRVESLLLKIATTDA